jgi:hypothetical protein
LGQSKKKEVEKRKTLNSRHGDSGHWFSMPHLSRRVYMRGMGNWAKVKKKKWKSGKN